MPVLSLQHEMQKQDGSCLAKLQGAILGNSEQIYCSLARYVDLAEGLEQISQEDQHERGSSRFPALTCEDVEESEHVPKKQDQMESTTTLLPQSPLSMHAATHSVVVLTWLSAAPSDSQKA